MPAGKHETGRRVLGLFCEKHKVSVAAPFMRIFLVGFSCFPRGNLQFSGCADLTNRKKGLRIAVISKPMIGNSTRCKTAKRAPFGETGCGLRGEWLHEGGRENRPTFGRVRRPSRNYGCKAGVYAPIWVVPQEFDLLSLVLRAQEVLLFGVHLKSQKLVYSTNTDGFCVENPRQPEGFLRFSP